jgi:hypothetical protein
MRGARTKLSLRCGVPGRAVEPGVAAQASARSIGSASRPQKWRPASSGSTVGTPKRPARRPRRCARSSALTSSPSGVARAAPARAQRGQARRVVGVGTAAAPHMAQQRSTTRGWGAAGRAQASASRSSGSGLKGCARRVQRHAVLRASQCTWRKVQARLGSISAGPLWPQCCSSRQTAAAGTRPRTDSPAAPAAGARRPGRQRARWGRSGRRCVSCGVRRSLPRAGARQGMLRGATRHAGAQQRHTAAWRRRPARPGGDLVERAQAALAPAGGGVHAADVDAGRGHGVRHGSRLGSGTCCTTSATGAPVSAPAAAAQRNTPFGWPAAAQISSKRNSSRSISVTAAWRAPAAPRRRSEKPVRALTKAASARPAAR